MKRFLLLSLLAILFGTKPAMAGDYVPLVREGVEWGYAHEYPGVHYGNMTYFRLQFSGTTELNGKTYHNLWKYSSYNLQFCEDKEIAAYMREENKRVYVYTDSEIFPADGSKEYLLYDFNISKGESYDVKYIRDDKPITISCTETGYVDTPDGKRRYMKIESEERYYSRQDMLVEGVGPYNSERYLHSGIIYRPYFAETNCYPDCNHYDVLLYQREVILDGNDENKYLQGKMLWTNPACYEKIGVHDPSVWQWHKAGAPWGGVESTMADGTDVEIKVEDNAVNVSSASTDILYVETFDLEGRMLTTVKPVNNRCQIPLSTISGVAVVKVTTTTGSYSTKVASK